MANHCDFIMQITGRRENVEELIDMLKWQRKHKDEGLGRVYECWEDDIEELNEEFISAQVSGYCAWSVLTAMRNYGGRYPSLESETERLNLLVELYSSESGMGFQEHCMIDKGEVVIDECVDYEEHYVEDYDSIEDYNAEYGMDLTEDMVEDGYVYIGGYGSQYGNFMKVEINK